MLSWLAGVLAAATAADADDLLAAYEASVVRCGKRGSDKLVMSLHSATTAAQFQAALEAAALPEHKPRNVFHKAMHHVNALSMHSIHDESLKWAARHVHVRHIEASCNRLYQLPSPANLSGLATLFEGRYRPTNGSQSACWQYISVTRPGAANSRATVFSNMTVNPRMNCPESGVGVVTRQATAAVQMIRDHVGYITMEGSKGVPMRGEYHVDPNGRLQDTIRWSNGVTWAKSLGPAYDLNSDIGPVAGATPGTRARNERAQVRWNWGLDRIDHHTPTLDNTYAYGNATGNGTTLYIMDTGTMIAHDDFGGRAVRGYSAGCPLGIEPECVFNWAFQGVITPEVMGRTAQGCSTHGTHTASTAAGSLYGVASAAEVIPVQVLSCAGSGSDAHVLDGINWAIAHAVNRVPRRPSVMSLSLGGGQRSAMLDYGVARAVEFGVLVVVAAGNDADDACEGSPAGAAEVITVGATQMNEALVQDGRLVEGTPEMFDEEASFSAHGSCVDIFAPGVEILAAVPSVSSTHVTSIMSGTSMATPMVSGVALQIWGLFPQLSADDVRRALLCTGIHGAIRNLDHYTRNLLLQGGAQLDTAALRAVIGRQRELSPDARAVGAQAVWDATECHSPERITLEEEPANNAQAASQKAPRASNSSAAQGSGNPRKAPQRALQP